jgi:hypothetical protein
MNVLSLTSGELKNFVGTLTTATTGIELVATTTTNTVIRVSSLLFTNSTTGTLSTATLNLVSGALTHAIASGVDVDPAQVPTRVVTKDSPIYLTGSQSLRGFGSGSNVVAIVAYEELR